MTREQSGVRGDGAAPDTPVTSPGASLTPGPTLTLEGAARACGSDRASMQRAVERDEFPNAYRDPADGVTWLIPVNDLRTAGYALPESEPFGGSAPAD